jgi:protein TonB
MPRDLFGEVTRPSISVGSRRWYTLPLSLLSHSAIVILAIAIPVLATPLMPTILDAGDGGYLIEILPPPPPPPLKRLETVTPVDAGAAPIEASEGVNEEPTTLNDLPAGSQDGWIGGADNLDTILEPPPPPIVQQPPPPAPVRVGYGVRAPQKLREVNPVYPPIAQTARVQGIVIIEATIGADGHVTNARILRSVPLLDQAAIDAVKQWEFTPTLLNGVPVPVVMTVTVNFTLK